MLLRACFLECLDGSSVVFTKPRNARRWGCAAMEDTHTVDFSSLAPPDVQSSGLGSVCLRLQNRQDRQHLKYAEVIICLERQPPCFVIFQIVGMFILTRKEQSPDPFWETDQTLVSHISTNLS